MEDATECAQGITVRVLFPDVSDFRWASRVRDISSIMSRSMQ
jgi:hypothetical protein